MIQRWAATGLSLLALVAVAQAQWKPADGPLKTRWAKDVAPETVHREYPRPQMVRPDWQNLNGLWDYAITAKDANAAGDFQGKILVPFPVESALSGVMKPVDEKSSLWYRRTFETPAGWSGKRVLLHFGAVDWEATVFVNGKQVGQHRGGYDGFSFDITDALKQGSPQELVVKVFDPTDAGGQPRGKQVRRPNGIWYTPTTGIWRTVWLEPVAQANIATLKMVPDLDASALKLTVKANGADAATVEAVALAGGQEVARATGKPGEAMSLSIPQPKLWTPDSPFLYDLKVTLKQGNSAVDAVSSYFGMRKIALGKDDKGITRILLNNQFVFQAGPLDQGFWPDGLYTAPTDEALRFDIEMTKKFGMNMARKHVKVEPDRWYYWCDKLGLLVWQDMPSSNNNTPEMKKNFEQELAAVIDDYENHPCIIMWVVFNEGWGQYDTERLTAWTKQRDPSRIVNNASGWTDKKVGDVIDMHNYPGPGSPKPEPTRAAVLGEFGGLGLAVEGHRWTASNWGYQGMASPEMLTRRYVRLWQGVWRLKDDPGLCAAVYTQTTDVETECNGLMTYDREINKGNLEQMAAAALGKVAPLPPVKTLVPTAQNETARATWQYTFQKPADDWFKPGFDASGWKSGRAGFGTRGTPGAIVRTQWNTPDIWIRREVELPEGNLGQVRLMMHHDEDAEVYINGVLAAQTKGFLSEYEEIDLTPEGKAALKSGKNTIAVHCHQTAGGQYIDVGLVSSPANP